jgi:hypothetical protein
MNLSTLAASAAGVLRLVFYLKDLNFGWEIDMTISVFRIEFAKDGFRRHGVYSTGNSGSQTLSIASSGTSSAIPRSAYN